MKLQMRIAVMTTVLMMAMGVASSHATVSFIADARIVTTRVFATNQGVCSAQVNVNVNTAGNRGLNNCANNFVSFGCDGEYVSKSAAQPMFSQAQLAQITGRRVSISVDDTKRYNENQDGIATCTATVIVVN